MPALPVVPEVVALDFVYTTLDDTGMQNRTYWQYAGAPPTVSSLGTLVSGARAAWVTYMQPLFNASVNLAVVKAIDLSSPTGAVNEDTTVTPGTRSGAQLPLNCAVVQSFILGRRYRGGHPRNYVPAFSTGDIDHDRIWLPDSVTEFGDAFSSFIAAIGTSGWSGDVAQVNVSYYSGYAVITLPSGRARNQPTLRVTPLVDAISDMVTRAKIGSQRKRLGKPF